MPAFLLRAHTAVTNYRLSRLAKRNDFDPRDALLVFSDPRGGSTWITEMIQQVPRTAVVWEPLHLRYTDAFRKLGFGWRQHIPEDAEWEEARAVFEQVLRGRLLNEKLCSITDVAQVARAEQLIVKFCRGNALLPWLVRQFEFRHKPVYLVRHPFAVAASQLRFGAWDWEFKGMGVPKGRFNERYLDHKDFLESITTKEESLVATWCLTNLVPLQHPKNNVDWITIPYETLLLEPEPTLKRIFETWDMPLPPGVLDRVREASQTTREATFETSVEAQLRKWQGQFSDEQVRRMAAVLDYFEVELYDTRVEPLVTL